MKKWALIYVLTLIFAISISGSVTATDTMSTAVTSAKIVSNATDDTVTSSTTIDYRKNTSAGAVKNTKAHVYGVASSSQSRSEGTSTRDKMSLWTGSSKLRGANIWQRQVYLKLDGSEFLGPGPVGPPYSQNDINRMAKEGSNLVIISCEGLYNTSPPYSLNKNFQKQLDNLLAMIRKADMFAVIAFRNGPGRTDFTFYPGEDVKNYLDDSVWEKKIAQDKWVEMWRYTANRYKNNPIVVGYDLMVEPNANAIYGKEQIYDPDEFYAKYKNSLRDWNQFYPRIVKGIREVDKKTPILVQPMGWGSLRWLPYLKVVNDKRVVYSVHQYEPQEQYTHQESPINTYPGKFDANWDGKADNIDKNWLNNLLSTVDKFKAKYHVPVAVTEFGVIRWQPGAVKYMDDEMSLFEKRGMNYAFYCWGPSWKPYAERVDDFDYLHGTNPNYHKIVSNPILNVINKYWAKNIIRPSNFK